MPRIQRSVPIRWSLFSLCTLFVASLVVAWLALPALAFAHAELYRSDPRNGAVLDTPPAEAKLYFTEDVGLEFSSAVLYDRSQKEYPTGTLTHSGSDTASMVVPLPQDIPNGAYILIWRVISGVDGHLTLGTVSFNVGPVDPNEPPINSTFAQRVGNGELSADSDNADPFRWVVRAWVLAAATLLLGGSVFTVLIIEPSAAESDQEGETLWRAAGARFAGVAAGVAAGLIAGLVFDLLAQVALIGNTDLLAALSQGDTLLTLLNSTRFGFAWIMKALAAALLLFLMILVWAFNRRGGSGLWEIGIAAGSLLLLAESLSSHAAAAVNYGQLLGLPIPLISDWLHLVTVATWTGGLGYMVLVLFPTFRRLNYTSETRRAFLARSIPRFSRLAIVSVITLATTGLFNLVVHTIDVEAIITTTYGQVLLIKVALFVVLVALGAVNLRRLSPRLQAARTGKTGGTLTQMSEDSTNAVTGLWHSVQLEAVLAATAIVCAAGLTLLPPPTGGIASTPVASTQQPVAQPTPDSTVASSSQTVGAGYTLTMTLQKGDTADQVTLEVLRSDPASPPLTDVTTMIFRVTPQDLEAGSSSFEQDQTDTLEPDKAAWKVKGAILPIDGHYIINVTLRRLESDDLRAAFSVNVAEGSSPVVAPTTALQVRLVTDPSPPISGTVKLSITLLDGDGKPIEGAQLSVAAGRPASQEAPLVVAALPVEGNRGVFIASFDLHTPGSWLLAFTVERPGLPTLKSDAGFDVQAPDADTSP